MIIHVVTQHQIHGHVVHIEMVYAAQTIHAVQMVIIALIMDAIVECLHYLEFLKKLNNYKNQLPPADK